jgi:MoaA/NifB/PqqE/SkfB family radical SAM enzyme
MMGVVRARARAWFYSEAADLVVRDERLRGWLLARGRQRLRRFFVDDGHRGVPERVREMRYVAIRNLLESYSRALADGRISPRVRRAFLRNFVGQVVMRGGIRPYVERHGEPPPAFLTISPTQICNLDCAGCCFCHHDGRQTTLPYDLLQRILDDKRANWGSRFTVVSGGEPLLYRSQGLSILDVFERNSLDYHLMYTNGTLITRDVARRMAELGNVTPAIQVDGGRQETDARRGPGVYDKLLAGMANLRAEGVPFGISITGMRHNAELVMSPKFLDFWFREQGAVHGWVFQYMPIGRSPSIDCMITPEQHRWMLERQIQAIYEDRYFLVDFWNGGPLSEGCIAAGRDGGYLYINWNGDVTPCAFFPYAVANVHDLYREGRDLTSVLQHGLLRSLRGLQEERARGSDDGRLQTPFTPCPIRDHYHVARDLIDRHQPRPLDGEAATLEDDLYRERMLAIGARVKELFDPFWGENGDFVRGELREAGA